MHVNIVIVNGFNWLKLLPSPRSSDGRNEDNRVWTGERLQCFWHWLLRGWSPAQPCNIHLHLFILSPAQTQTGTSKLWWKYNRQTHTYTLRGSKTMTMIILPTNLNKVSHHLNSLENSDSDSSSVYLCVGKKQNHMKASEPPRCADSTFVNNLLLCAYCRDWTKISAYV